MTERMEVVVPFETGGSIAAASIARLHAEAPRDLVPPYRISVAASSTDLIVTGLWVGEADLLGTGRPRPALGSLPPDWSKVGLSVSALQRGGLLAPLHGPDAPRWTAIVVDVLNPSPCASWFWASLFGTLPPGAP